MKKVLLLSLTVILSVGIAACSKKSTDSDSAFMHIHGLGYSSDGNRLLVPVHNGLSVYDNGKWFAGSGDKHDYMGFSASNDGFYSSGHPAVGSAYENPLGLIKSTNDGKSITVLALDGEVDFHGMTVGYRTHTIYALNQTPNSKMSQPGLFYSQDEGETWIKSEAVGLQGQITSISAHPTEKSIVAIGTAEGAFISSNKGESFTVLLQGVSISGITVLESGDTLVATSGPEAALYQISAETNHPVVINMPSTDDIMYIAQNPANPTELAAATLQKSVFISGDDGTSWHEIVHEGVTRN
ncbi:F510_1955 family glycosylhydrolase [Paenibacillus sp. OV219]|uniref:F510_1955 family glycosylhydrolase n=1 Tax=Paenibacillus sp. OV219 TaxID=1884377 RepID=UPI0008B487D3|nr:hypothetical protein [Paenibacillus sp. OV219]SEP15589.1 hypothetical protein SAMN05518847_12112 [Paenibacillus sp. OV219]